MLTRYALRCTCQCTCISRITNTSTNSKSKRSNVRWLSIGPTNNVATAYATLSIRTGAPISEVRAAYLQLVKKYHPDTAGDEHHSKFTQIQHAYEVLRNVLPENDGEWGDEEEKVEENERESFGGIPHNFVNHTVPQHRNYLSFEGKGHGTIFQRQAQYEKYRLRRAINDVTDYQQTKWEKQQEMEERMEHADRDTTTITTTNETKKKPRTWQDEKEQENISMIMSMVNLDRSTATHTIVDEQITNAMRNWDMTQVAGYGKPFQDDIDRVPVDFVAEKLNDIVRRAGVVPQHIDLEQSITTMIREAVAQLTYDWHIHMYHLISLYQQQQERANPTQASTETSTSTSPSTETSDILTYLRITVNDAPFQSLMLDMSKPASDTTSATSKIKSATTSFFERRWQERDYDTDPNIVEDIYEQARTLAGYSHVRLSTSPILTLHTLRQEWMLCIHEYIHLIAHANRGRFQYNLNVPSLLQKVHYYDWEGVKRIQSLSPSPTDPTITRFHTDNFLTDPLLYARIQGRRSQRGMSLSHTSTSNTANGTSTSTSTSTSSSTSSPQPAPKKQGLFSSLFNAFNT